MDELKSNVIPFKRAKISTSAFSNTSTSGIIKEEDKQEVFKMAEQGYSKQEIDLKLENIELKLSNKIDALDNKVDKLETKIDNLPTTFENMILKNNEKLRTEIKTDNRWGIGIVLTIIGLLISISTFIMKFL